MNFFVVTNSNNNPSMNPTEKPLVQLRVIIVPSRIKRLVVHVNTYYYHKKNTQLQYYCRHSFYSGGRTENSLRFKWTIKQQVMLHRL